MGKVKTRFLGLEDVEKQQKQEQKKKKHSKEAKKKVHLAGMKGGERTVTVEADEKAAAKIREAEKFVKEGPASAEASSFAKASEDKPAGKEKRKKVTKARVRGKKYQQAKKALSTSEKFDIDRAINLLKKIKYANFDESVELHLNTVKEGLKGEVQLPHSVGKTVRIKIVDDELLDQIEQGKIDFDVLVTHPSYMPKLAKLAKILGPKGLMPNPKTGTISDKPEEVAKKFAQGALRWKSEPKAPLIHLMVGKISYEPKKLTENVQTLINSVGRQNLKAVYIKTTMSPAIRLAIE